MHWFWTYYSILRCGIRKFTKLFIYIGCVLRYFHFLPSFTSTIDLTFSPWVNSAKHLGPVLKFVLCFGALPIPLILWPVVSIVASIIGGAAYGFFSPVLATFDAVGESKDNQLFHCIYVWLWLGSTLFFIIMLCSCLYGERLIYLRHQDGTWDTIKGCFTVIRDFGDFCYHSYRSFMQDLRQRTPPNGEHYEIRLFIY